MKVIHQILLVGVYCATVNVCYANKPLFVLKAETKLGVLIEINSTFRSTWNTVSYKPINDTNRIKKYLELLVFEFSKYPSGYINKIGVENIIICDSLNINNQRRNAIPDPYTNALFLDINSSSSDNYLVRVMHHELHHCTEYYLYKNMYFKWEKWGKVNSNSFKYGDGGISAYMNDNEIDWFTMVNSVKGFVDLYSTTAQEEDRCEIAAILMNDTERKLLFNYCKSDRILRKKTKLILKEMSKVVDTKVSYWKS